MGLLDIVRSGVKVADNVTKSLQATVSYQRYVSKNQYGELLYDNPVALKAVVDWKATQARTSTGILTVSRASIMLLDIEEVNAATGGQGISDEDIFVLPDGTTGPIVDLRGFIDAVTGHPVATEVLLG